MKPQSGTYVLILGSDSSASIEVGRWGTLDIRPGYYLYIGSAFGPGGVRARVSRHCRELKPRHWHIDYLREHADLVSIWYSHDPVRLEHRWAETVSAMGGMEPVMGFGCTDCKCASHLFFSAEMPGLSAFRRMVDCPVESWSCNALS